MSLRRLSPLFAIALSISLHANAGVPGQIITAKEDHSAAALKEAVQAEQLKKITTAPEEHPHEPEITAAVPEEGDLVHGDKAPASAPSKKAKVSSEAAPGTKATTNLGKKIEKTAEHAADSAKEASAKAEATAKEAEQKTASDAGKAVDAATEKVLGAAAPAAKAAAAPAAKPAAPAPAGVSPDQSLRWLTNGNVRYMKKGFRSDGKSDADRKRLLAGQHPHAVVLACSDSRVPPEIVFDQALGEISVVRVAGEALDASVLASVEHAVEHLGARLIVVLGHTTCGTVDAALSIPEGTSAGSEWLDKILADIRPRLKSVAAQERSANLEVESALNADGVARELVKRSELIRKKVESGDVVVKPALYRMDSGKVSFY